MNNKKAYHDYFILDELEVGIVLTGTEIKSIRNGKASIKESYCFIKNNELFIKNMHISPYDAGNRFNVDPIRDRKLLAHKKQITKFAVNTREKGMSIIPLKVYFNGNKCKLLIAVCKGKKYHDKRFVSKEKTIKKDIEKSLKRSY